MKRIFSALLSLIILSGTITVSSDEIIFRDPVRGEYIGRTNASSIISNINFKDLTDTEIFEPVARLGALNIIKGWDDEFLPLNNVTNVEMLASVIRLMGLEEDAVAAAARVAPRLPDDTDLRTELNVGYLTVANEQGFITNAEYAWVFGNQETAGFMYNAPVTRQQAAAWLYNALITLDDSAFFSIDTSNIQSVFNYSDWNRVSAANLTAVETLVAAGALTGAENRLNPNGYLSRHDFVNMYDAISPDVLYTALGVQERFGTVGGIKTERITSARITSSGANYYIRSDDGNVDKISNFITVPPRQMQTREIPVFNGEVQGLTALEEGNSIVYLINAESGEALYVSVHGDAPQEYIAGKFQVFNALTGQITILSEYGEETYTLVRGMYSTEDDVDYFYIDDKKQPVENLPVGSTIVLRLTNKLVDAITFIGEPNIVDEFRGIVIENNPDMGYLVVIDNQRRRIIKDYYSSDIRVKKREYYHNDDIVGFIDEVFPNFKYNPLESDISAIEPGDIVFIVNDPDDPDYIQSISAATNYIARYGKVLQYTYNADGFYEMLIEYENKQTSWFDVPESIFVSRSGRPIKTDDIQPGDWVRILVNQAIISPGYVIESAKEIVLEGVGHQIPTILRGQLAGLNPTQNQLQLQNVVSLTNTGWTNHKQAANYSLAGRDIEYYHDGERISLDYAMRHFRRADMDVYIALEGNYAGERIKKVTFRSGRDRLITDTIIHADGNGDFRIFAVDGAISTDSGTIIRRNGRLVDGTSIQFYDYAVVSLNGGNNAAVVDIFERPGNDAILCRARVMSVDYGTSFTVQSMAILSGTNWIFTPVQREFSIDYNTVFITPDGFFTYDRFTDYNSAVDDTVQTSVDKVYNVLSDGTRAAVVVDAPYSTRAVRGTIYAIEDGTVHLRNATYLDNMGVWKPVSNVSATLEITIPINSIILDRDQHIGVNSLSIGNNVTVMTSNTVPAIIPAGSVIEGYIVLVDK